MNENINLLEILKGAPDGTKLYSPLFGEILFSSIMNDEIICYVGDDMYFQGWEKIVAFNKYGQLLLSPVASRDPTREVMIFPCEDNRNWSTFKAPWKHQYFEPGQKILVPYHDGDIYKWRLTFYSHYDESIKLHVTTDAMCFLDEEVIAYEGNEDKLGKSIETK